MAERRPPAERLLDRAGSRDADRVAVRRSALRAAAARAAAARASCTGRSRPAASSTTSGRARNTSALALERRDGRATRRGASRERLQHVSPRERASASWVSPSAPCQPGPTTSAAPRCRDRRRREAPVSGSCGRGRARPPGLATRPAADRRARRSPCAAASRASPPVPPAPSARRDGHVLEDLRTPPGEVLDHPRAARLRAPRCRARRPPPQPESLVQLAAQDAPGRGSRRSSHAR